MSRRGMTLAETLTTTAIMGVLVGLLIPAVQHVREAARRTTCLNNLRQIGLSIHNYESSFGRLPPGTIGYAEAVDWNDFRKTPDEPYWKSVQHTSALTLVLSYLEEDRAKSLLHKRMFDVSNLLIGARNEDGSPIDWFGLADGFEALSEHQISLFSCPTDNMAQLGESVRYMGGSQPVTIGRDQSDALSFVDFLDELKPGKYVGTNYLGCSGAASGGIHPDPERDRYRGAMSSGEVVRFSSIVDGSTNTILFGESVGQIKQRKREFVQPWNIGGLARGRGGSPWMSEAMESCFGNLLESHAGGFGSAHAGGVVNFVMVDGGIKSMNAESDRNIVYALSGRFDGKLTSSTY